MLKGFVALHEMTAADADGGEEEVWQVIKALGYDKQLQLNQASIRTYILCVSIQQIRFSVLVPTYVRKYWQGCQTVILIVFCIFSCLFVLFL